MTTSRELSVFILQDILENKVFASEAKNKHLPKDYQETAFVNMLLQTGLRHLVYIKSVIKNYAQKKFPQNARVAHYSLILGTAELLYMNTPNYAVINSYVDITKKHTNKYIAGFTNAVLRKIATEKDRFKSEDTGIFFPPEFRKLLSSSYNKKTINFIEQASIKEPFLDISTITDFNLPQSTILPLGGLRLKNNGNITQIEGYQQGLWWVQDFSSAFAVNTLNNIKDKRVLDLCAAPGGKTAQLIAKGAKVTALDISEERLKRLTENLSRLNLHTEATICADATDWLTNYHGEPFDIILLDAPCSATGTLRRHPELVHIKKSSDVETVLPIQKQLLEQSANTLKKGGLLIYCTCSLSKQEGEQQISSFLQKHPDFKTHQVSIPSELSVLLTPEGWIRILPSHLTSLGGADGFFISILDKVN
ncbi:MAG: methyltransferase domain-containing protein [Alphaproteobacteria bacterium]|nr:methyltransferase domain-containing protein [Alphaproteobacteria bacterium]